MDYNAIVAYQLEFAYVLGGSIEQPRKAEAAPDDATGDIDVSSQIGPITLVIEQGQLICVQSKLNSAGKK